MSNHDCSWARSTPLMQRYHDEEWGNPVRDDQKLWEMLVLESFQAGLSWQIILNRRDGIREAFNNFDAGRIAAYGDKEIDALMANPAMIRSRAKIQATVGNARAYLALQDRDGGLSKFSWGSSMVRLSWVTASTVRRRRRCRPQSPRLSGRAASSSSAPSRCTHGCRPSASSTTTA